MLLLTQECDVHMNRLARAKLPQVDEEFLMLVEQFLLTLDGPQTRKVANRCMASQYVVFFLSRLRMNCGVDTQLFF